MRTFYECLPCFVNQALGVLQRTGVTDPQIKSVMKAVFCELAEIDFCAPPPVTSGKVFRFVRKTIGESDPYKAEKKKFNQFAMHLLSEVQDRVCVSQNVFLEKIKLSIAANIIDFGKKNNLTEDEVRAVFDRALEKHVDETAVSDLQDALKNVKSILYLCDNAGEIVFDRFLIEEMPHKKIICAVRGAPVINDATVEDAAEVRLNELVKVISTGSDMPGVVLDECSPEFNKVFNEADIIISKGQGNFETLSEIQGKRIFFLLQVKCPVIAEHIGFPVGSFVIKDNQNSTIRIPELKTFSDEKVNNTIIK